ncbi:YkyB family protein [Bacillus sp. FJAT-42315]|uniref:YkyB family protein n=1 Tax=Bacillus sp. FJAT-42315 TaxID=2014077 RepID=UPI000C24D39D|nr:YkyB family protein [Bacillus sp. FJAT-42315]
MNNLNSHNKSLPHSPSTVNLAQAIFTVNRHAKTAINPKFLYLLKKKALIRMIQEGRAKKTGLHFSNNPKNSQQQSDVLVTCGEYTFHMPPCKEDFHNLPHFGHLDQKARNPRSSMNLMEAKKILQAYTGMKEKQTNSSSSKKRYKKPVFKPLGQSY